MRASVLIRRLADLIELTGEDVDIGILQHDRGSVSSIYNVERFWLDSDQEKEFGLIVVRKAETIHSWEDAYDLIVGV